MWRITRGCRAYPCACGNNVRTSPLSPHPPHPRILQAILTVPIFRSAITSLPIHPSFIFSSLRRRAPSIDRTYLCSFFHLFITHNNPPSSLSILADVGMYDRTDGCRPNPVPRRTAQFVVIRVVLFRVTYFCSLFHAMLLFHPFRCMSF